MRMKRIAAVAFATLGIVAAMAPPASADPDVAVFTGTATTGPIWAPGFGPTLPTPVGWAFNSTAPSVGNVNGAGTLTGWCGHSTGTGTATVTNLSSHNSKVGWISVGTVIIITGPTTTTTITTKVNIGSHAVAAVVAARANQSAQGPGACVLYGATQFDVVGAAVVAG